MASDAESYSTRVLTDLHDGLDEASSAALSHLDVGELNEFLVESYRLKQRADALFANAVLEATNQQVAKRHGEHSLSTHIAAQVHGNSKSIGSHLALARWLHRFPQLHLSLIHI